MILMLLSIPLFFLLAFLLLCEETQEFGWILLMIGGIGATCLGFI